VLQFEKKSSRCCAGQAAPFSFQTPQGTAAIGPGGVSWTGQIPQNIPIGSTGYQIAPVQQESILDKIKANPALLGLAALPLVFLMMPKKGSGKK
jgi:hypothetical protein